MPISGGEGRAIVKVVATGRKIAHDEFPSWSRERQGARGDIPRTRDEFDGPSRAEQENRDEG